jgi:hypothetical protein
MTRDEYLSALRAFPWARLRRSNKDRALVARLEELRLGAAEHDRNYAVWNRTAPALWQVKLKGQTI